MPFQVLNNRNRIQRDASVLTKVGQREHVMRKCDLHKDGVREKIDESFRPGKTILVLTEIETDPQDDVRMCQHRSDLWDPQDVTEPSSRIQKRDEIYWEVLSRFALAYNKSARRSAWCTDCDHHAPFSFFLSSPDWLIGREDPCSVPLVDDW